MPEGFPASTNLTLNEKMSSAIVPESAFTPLPMKYWETWSLYICISNRDLRYSTGRTFAANDDLRVMEGAGAADFPPFAYGLSATFYAPRVFNGRLRYEYECANHTSLPTAASADLTDDTLPTTTQTPSSSEAPSFSLELASSATSFADITLSDDEATEQDLQCYAVEVKILFDSSPFGKGWDLMQSESGSLVQSFSPLDDALANQWYNTSECVAEGNYTFTIFDHDGGGLCCAGDRRGKYLLVVNGTVVAQGGEFEGSEEVLFRVPFS